MNNEDLKDLIKEMRLAMQFVASYVENAYCRH